MKDFTKGAALFAAGTLFGSIGLKLLASKDAQKVYIQTTAAGLRIKDEAMKTVTCVQESAADILASAKELNEERAAKEAAEEEASEIHDNAEEETSEVNDAEEE